jgi:hypothetical protein
MAIECGHESFHVEPSDESSLVTDDCYRMPPVNSTLMTNHLVMWRTIPSWGTQQKRAKQRFDLQTVHLIRSGDENFTDVTSSNGVEPTSDVLSQPMWSCHSWWNRMSFHLGILEDLLITSHDKRKVDMSTGGNCVFNCGAQNANRDESVRFEWLCSSSNRFACLSAIWYEWLRWT